jgi:hypothetical protein
MSDQPRTLGLAGRFWGEKLPAPEERDWVAGWRVEPAPGVEQGPREVYVGTITSWSLGPPPDPGPVWTDDGPNVG